MARVRGEPRRDRAQQRAPASGARRADELCAVVKADGYGQGAAGRARRRWPAGQAGWPWRPRMRRCSCGGGSRLRALLVMGALSEEETARALAAGGRRGLAGGAARAGRAGRGRARPREARQRHGQARDARPGAGHAGGRGRCATPGLGLAGRDDPFRDRRHPDGFFAVQLESFDALGSGPSRRPTPMSRSMRPTAPRTLREPPAHFDMVRCGVAHLRHGPSARTPLRAGWSRRLNCAPTSPRSSAARSGESAGYGRMFVAGKRHQPGGGADRVRRRLPAGAVGQRRGADRRPALSAGRSGQHGQRDRRSRALRRAPARPRGRADRRQGGRAHHRRAARPAARDDQLRGHVRVDRAGAALYRDGEPWRRRRAEKTARASPWRTSPQTAGGEPDASRARDRARELLEGAWRVGGACSRSAPPAARRPDLVVGGVRRTALALARRPATWPARAVPAGPRGPARGPRAGAGKRAACFALSGDLGPWRVVADTGAWQVDLEALRGGTSLRRSRPARLYNQRRRRTDSRRRADRPARRSPGSR